MVCVRYIIVNTLHKGVCDNNSAAGSTAERPTTKTALIQADNKHSKSKQETSQHKKEERK
jgi:hypothetical protein